MIFSFRPTDDALGLVVSLETTAALEITVITGDGYRRHEHYSWDVSVAYERVV